MSPAQVLNSTRPPWLKRHRSLGIAVAITMIVAVIATAGITMARAAIGSVSEVTLSIVSDGTAPFDTNDDAGNDSGANNGIVRAGDTVTYRWAYSVATAGDITFTQALPAGMKWDVASTTSCSQGAGAISGQTITCTIANAPAGAGAYNVKAKAVGAANEANLATSVTATTGGVSSSSVSVKASAVTRANLDFTFNGAFSQGNGPGSQSSVSGFTLTSDALMYMPLDPTRSAFGLQALTSPITFTVTSVTAGGTLSGCAPGGTNSARSPSSSGGGASAVVNSGSWTCTQPEGPGSPITVTVTGADSSLSSYPSKSSGGNPLDTSRAYFATGRVLIWYPETSIPAGVSTTIVSQASGFDPNGLDGNSNYGTGYAPQQSPGDACGVAASVSNCSSGVINRRDFTFNTGVWLVSATDTAATKTTPLEDANAVNTGDGPLYSEEKYTVALVAGSLASNATIHNFSTCGVWDPTLQQIDTSSQSSLSMNGAWVAPSDFVVEYGTASYADDAARRATTCGEAGDGNPQWFTSVAAAGGSAAVTGVRYVFKNNFNSSNTLRFYVPMVAKTVSATPGTPVATFMQYSGTEFSVRKSTYIAATHSNTSNGSRGLAANAKVRNTVAWDQTSTAAGTVRQVTVQPTVTNPFDPATVTAQDVTVTVKLPSACVPYQNGSASLTPISVTPLGSCSNGDAGQTIVFDLGPWPTDTPVPPITFNTVINPLIAAPSTQTVTSVIGSASDTALASVRTKSSALQVNSPAIFAVTKTASSATATPGVPFTYTIGWANRLTATAGTASFVDVLPFNGDSRGTTGLNGLTVNFVTPSAGSTTVWYTSDPSLAVQSAVASDPSGMTGITWTQTKPATVTAIQFRTGELTPGTVQSADISVTPGEFSRTGVIKNDVWGKASAVAAPVQGAAQVSMTSSAAELSGNVYNDVDYSFSKTVLDIPVASPIVKITGGYSYGPDGIDNGGAGDDIPLAAPITANSSANGDYDFPGVAPGKYTVTVTPLAGTHVAVSPTMPIALASGATVTGKDFGVQADLTPSVAKDDTKSVGINSTNNTINVLANDTINDASVKITKTGATTKGGTVTIAADGQSVVYAPAAGFVGDDTFTYTIADKSRQESTATVTVHVVAAPAAQNDSAQTGEQQPVTVNVLANDTGLNLNVTGKGANSDGTVTINANNTITYTPKSGFSGVTSFTYTVTDSVGQTDTATVTVNVVKKPVAQDDSATIAQGATATVNVLANDTATQPRVTFALTSDGSVVVNADNTVSFTPAAGFSGTATVDYTITDAVGQSASAQIVVTVVPKPVAQDDDATTGQEKPVVVDVLSNDLGEDLAVSIAADPAHGTASVGADDRVTYTPAVGFAGTDTFTYTVTDPLGQSATATVTITVVAGPVAVDDSALTKQDTAVTVDLIGNDVGDGITLTSLGADSDGTITDNGDGTITFTPNAGFTGSTEFTYVETDRFGNTSTGTVTIRVIAIPVAVDEYVTTGAGKPVTVDVLDNDLGTGLTVTGVDVNVNGTVKINTDGTVTFAPNADFTGDTEVNYTVTDVVGQEATATIHIHVAATPVANPDTVKTPQSTAVTVAVLGNDTGEALSLTSIGDPASPTARDAVLDLPGGEAVLNDDGTITFTPKDGFSGVVTIPYTVTDGIGQTSSSTLTVTVVKAPTAPDIKVTTKQDNAVTVKPMEQVTGENVSIVSVSKSADGEVVLNDDGTITFTPKKGFVGETSFTYTVVDDLGQATTATVTVTVTAAPIPPTPPTPAPTPTPGGNPASGAGGGLAITGGDIAGVGIAAAILLALGGTALALARRRRRGDRPAG